jgi:hypothetical protein
VDGQITILIDMISESFPIFDRQRREGLIGVPAEDIHRYQQTGLIANVQSLIGMAGGHLQTAAHAPGSQHFAHFHRGAQE